MKKDKTNKNLKKSDGAIKPKWKLWMTIVCVILGVGLIAGVTILGVILARGGTDERPVVPQSIEITYQEDLYNADNAQLEVTDNFTLTITSPTEGVNRLQVELSLSVPEGQTLIYSTDDGVQYVSNSIITVPQFVNINEPFTVTLDKRRLQDDEGNFIYDENNDIVNWIRGGIASITARSTQNNEADPVSLSVAVDVPVYSTQTVVINSNGEQTDQIILDEQFTLQTKFLPSESQYMFSDNQRYSGDLTNENIRYKRSFYQAPNSEGAITPHYDPNGYDMYFQAGEVTTNAITITGYTFRNAYDQIAAEENYADVTGENFYQRMLRTLAENNTGVLSSEVISLGEASIGSFNVTNQTLSMNSSAPIRLYLNNPEISDARYLGVSIRSTSGQLIDYMLKNIAISFEFNGEDPTQEGEGQLLQISGGDAVVIDGKTYYMPFSDVQDRNYSYWDITALDYLQRGEYITINVVLLIEREDESFEIFENSTGDVVYQVRLTISQHIEQAVSWADGTEIDVVLDYYDNGQIIPENINLSNKTSVPESNIYQDIIFFAYFGDGEVEELTQVAQSVLGVSGINMEQSGQYPTSGGSLYLFALNGSNLTIYNSGEFELYFATIVTVNGAPVIDDTSRYQISQMVSTPVQVSVSKALNDDSITNKEIDTANYDEEGEDTTFIDQGNLNTFTLRFTVAPEMVEVFQDELNNGYMSIVIRDNSDADITSYFSGQANPLFTTNDETGEGILEYNLILSEGVTIDGNIYLASFALVYNNTDISREIIWQQQIDKNICVYAPVASSIAIMQPVGYGYSNYITANDQNQNESISRTTVNQTLETNGFVLNIGVGAESFTTTAQFLTALLGDNFSYVVITDQNGQTDTLQGEWEFDFVSENTEGININGQNINFTTANNSVVSVALKTTDSAGIYSNAVAGGNVITFVVTSTGITRAEHQSSANLDPYTTDQMQEASNISEINVRKYGAVATSGDGIINLADYVNYYAGDDEYANISFTLSASYFISTSSETLQALFGDNGMISLYNGASQIAYSSLNSSTVITSFKINKDFASSRTLNFTVTDANSTTSAFSFAFNLTLSANLSISSNVDYGTAANPLYAGTSIRLTNTVTFNNNNSGGISALSGFYNGTYYIVPASVTTEQRAQYIVSQEAAGAVGEINNGEISFYDFWDQESRSFSVLFTPQGDNTIAASIVLTFNVSRNLSIELNKDTYYLFDNQNNQTLNSFITYTRASDGEVIGGLEILGAFDQYLTFDNSYIVKDEGNLLFGYNQKNLTSQLSISIRIDGQTYNNIVSFEINIELFDPSQGGQISGQSVYDYIATKALSSSQTDGDGTYNAQTQIVDGIEYIVFTNTSWNLSQTIAVNDDIGFVINLSQRDLSGNSKTNIYTVVGDEGGLSLQPQSELLAGLDDDSYYLVARFGTSNSALDIYMYIPMIISNIGYDYVTYSDELLGTEAMPSNEKLARALTRVTYVENEGSENEQTYTGAVALIKESIYDEINAGEITQILQGYTLNDYFENSLDKAGLYALSELSYLVEYFPVSTSDDIATDERIIKLIDHDPTALGNANVDLSLNHLTTDYNNFYLVLSLTLSNTSDSVELYYVLKVVPDIVDEASKYAYNGSSEYIDDTSDPINLDETFSNITLNEGYTRFNVSKNITLITTVNESEETGDESTEVLLDELTIDATRDMTIEFTANVTVDSEQQKIAVRKTFNLQDESSLNQTINLNDAEYFNGQLVAGDVVNVKILSGRGSISYNGKEVFRNLSFAQEVSSVEVDGQVLTDENAWSQFVNIYFQGSDMYVTPINQNEMTITIKRTYNGSSGSNDLSVIGLEQYYKFIINASTHNYSVDISGENLTQDQQGNYIWTISNDDYSNDSGEETIDFNLTVLLKENAEAGSAESGTTVWNELEISLTEGNMGDNGDIAKFSYSNAAKDQGKFTLTRQDYLTSDREVKFTLYTKYGYLATLTVKLEANAEYALKDAYSQGELNGGSTPAFSDVFNILLNNEEAANYTVSVDWDSSSGDDVNFISFDGTNFQVADLFEDVNATLCFIITFEDANTFTFTQSFTLKANAVLSSSTVLGPTVIAGRSFDFTKNNAGKDIIFFESSPTLANSTISYTGNTANSAVKNNSECIDHINGDDNINENDQWQISTNYVNDVTNVTVTVTVRLTFGEAYQEGSFTYSFTIYPSVKLEPHYPMPNNTDKLTSEYLDNGTTFDDISTDFFNQAAIFSTQPRLKVLTGEVDASGTVNYNFTNNPDFEEDTNFTILITTLDNASLSSVVDDDSVEDDDSTKHYNESEAIPAGSNITFHLGTYNDSGYTDNGRQSMVVFTLRYQEVEITYTVIIQASALNVNILNSRYNADGSVGNDQVTYDILYVDKTSTSNIFGKNRIFEVSVNSGISINGNYYVIFGEGKQNTDGTYGSYYASYPQYITPAAGGVGLYYLDLGYSLPNNLTYLGLYASSAFETQCLMTDGSGELSVNTAHENYYNSDNIPVNNGEVVDALSNMTNVDYNKAVFSSTRLTSRVELVYGGYYVNYDFYGTNINVAEGAVVGSPFTIDPNTVELDEIYSTNPLTSYNRNDGSNNSTKNFTATYYYMTSLDIDVEYQINGSAGNIRSVTVNDEVESLVELVGIIHPTSGEPVSSADFGADRAHLNFEIIPYDSDTNLGDTVAEGYLDYYLSAYHLDSFALSYNESAYNYMSYSARLNSSMAAFDYTLFPNGAKLNGDYVLGEITYQSNGFTKTYYVVLLIKPDYIVTFDGSSENATKDETTGVISNIDNVYNISSLTTTGENTTYNTFILTGDQKTNASATEKSIISIKHANGSNTNVELSTSNFTLTMPQEKSVDGQTYNNQTNINQKLAEALKNLNNSAGWTETNGIWTYGGNLGAADRKATKIDGAKEVIFGSQYFYIQGEDRYGYKFELYFSLQSSNPIPRVEQGGARLRLEELSYFDVGANFETVTVTKGEDAYKVTSRPTSPSGSGNVTMIEVQGVESYLFNEEYAKGTEDDAQPPEKYYLEKNSDVNGGYTAKTGEGDMWTTEYQKYFTPALIEYITVDSVSFYDLDGNVLSFLAETGKEITTLTPTATTEATTGYILATDSELYYNHHSGYKARDAYPIPTSDSETGSGETTEPSEGETTEDAAYYALQIPRFVDTDIFGSGSIANVTMTIKLKYLKGDTVEYYDLRVDVTIVREVTIETNSMPAIRDGQQFDVADEFRISSDENLNSGINTEFVNDTLEVLVNSTSNATFEVRVVRGLETFTGVGQASNSSSIKRTSYLSISNIIGTNVRKGDMVTIIPQDENAEYYYITNNNSIVVNNHFKVTAGDNGYVLTPASEETIDYIAYDFVISTIQKDAIYVEHASLLENNRYYTVTKYYVVNVNFDPDDVNSDSDGLDSYMSYRTQKTYSVTGYYYNISGATTDEIIKEISSEDNGNTSTFSQWSDGVAAYIRDSRGQESKEPILAEYLTFTLNKTADSGISGGTLGSGNASIDENGTITFNQYFNYNQYIKVVIGMYVSGTDRNISEHDTGEATYNFSPIRLGWDKDYALNTILVNTVVNGSQSTIRMKNGATVKDLPKPELDGYRFSGWSLTADGEILEDEPAPQLEANTTYYAIFSVSVIANGETKKFSSSNPSSLTVSLLGEGSWSIDNSTGGGGIFQVLFSGSLLIDGANYVSVVGNIINVQVSIADELTSYNYISTATVENLPTPSLEGYKFLGWSLAAEGEILENSTQLVAGTTYYAIFEPSFVILQLGEDLQGKLQIRDGETTDILFTFDFSYLGVLTGYRLNGEGDLITVESDLPLENGGIYVAEWETINITLVENKSASSERTVRKGSTIADLPLLEAYNNQPFIGYSLTENGYILNNYEKVIADQTYYAIYGQAIQVRLYLADEANNYSNFYYRSFNYSDTATIKDLIGDSVTNFKGYSATMNGYKLADTTTLRAGSTYYMLVGDLINVTIHYTKQNGEATEGASESFQYISGTTVRELPSKTYSGYIFAGWGESQNSNSIINSNLTLKDGSHYYALFGLNVTLMLPSGEQDVLIMKYEPSKLTLNDLALYKPTNIDGWNTDNEAQTYLDLTTKLESTTYYGMFEITLVENNSVETKQIVSVTKTVSDLVYNTFEGYNFAGWSTSAGAEEVLPQNEFLYNQKTYYALYSIRVTVLLTGDQTETKTFYKNNTSDFVVSLLGTVENETEQAENNFSGWRKADEDPISKFLLDENALLENNCRYLAVMKGSRQTITLVIGEEEQTLYYAQNETFEEDAKLQIKDLPKPTLEGQSFEGWKKEDGEDVLEETTEVENGAKYHAVFKAQA